MAAIAAAQEQAAEAQRKVAVLRSQTGEEEQAPVQTAAVNPTLVQAAVIKSKARPGKKQRQAAKRKLEEARVGSMTKIVKTNTDQHATGQTYAQRAVSLRMSKPVAAVFAQSGSTPLCIARVATDTLYYMYGNLLPTGKRYRVIQPYISCRTCAAA